MRKFFTFALVLFMSLAVHAQSVIDLDTVDPNLTTNFNGELVLDMAKTASKAAAPKLTYANPLKGQKFTEAQISFDIYNYGDAKVLGCLFSFLDPAGRMYFSNGSYLGYNATGGWYDANMINYGLGKNYLGKGIWKKVKLQFTATGYAMYVNDTLAYNQSSTDITIANGITDHNNVLTFMKNASTLMFGTGSWWSDNAAEDGYYYDRQESYLKNFKISPDFSTALDLSTIDTTYTTVIDGQLVLDVLKTASKSAAPKLSYPNPFNNQEFVSAQISFDVINYGEPKVLGCLMAFVDGSGRMYFSNGSYLGYNATGGWYDANLISYGLGTDFIGNNTWKNLKLQFTPTGYAMYINDTLAFDQTSTNITIANGISDHTNVLTFLKNVSTLMFGTGSWWSDNAAEDGYYYDRQNSYLKNIKFTKDFPTSISITKQDMTGELIREEFFHISGLNVGTKFEALKPGLYIRKSVYSNGTIKSTKIAKAF